MTHGSWAADTHSVKTRAALLAGVTALTFSVSACASTEPTDTPDDAVGERADEPTTAEVLEEATPEPTPEPLEVSVTGPSTTTSNQVTLRGRVAVAGTKVRVAGKPAKVKGRTWTRKVTIKKTGDNRYKVVATKSGHDRDSTTAIVTRKLSKAEKQARTAAKRQTFMNSATTIPYNQLEKNPDRYKGKKVVYRGQIFQIQEDYGSTWLLLSVTDEGYGFWSDNVWVEFDGTIKGAEEDVITVYGTITGSESYETQIGGETYVPKLKARYVVE